MCTNLMSTCIQNMVKLLTGIQHAFQHRHAFSQNCILMSLSVPKSLQIQNIGIYFCPDTRMIRKAYFSIKTGFSYKMEMYFTFMCVLFHVQYESCYDLNLSVLFWYCLFSIFIICLILFIVIIFHSQILSIIMHLCSLVTSLSFCVI